jgi:hypothetical protein
MKEAHYNSIHQQYAIQQTGGGCSIPDLIGTEQQTLQGEPEVVEASNVRMHSSPRIPHHLQEPGSATSGGREAGKVLVGWCWAQTTDARRAASQHRSAAWASMSWQLSIFLH